MLLTCILSLKFGTCFLCLIPMTEPKKGRTGSTKKSLQQKQQKELAWDKKKKKSSPKYT